MLRQKRAIYALGLLLASSCAGTTAAQQPDTLQRSSFAKNVFSCTDEVGIRKAGLTVNFWMAEVLATPGKWLSFTCLISGERIPDSYFKDQGAQLLEVVFCRKTQDCTSMKESEQDKWE